MGDAAPSLNSNIDLALRTATVLQVTHCCIDRRMLSNHMRLASRLAVLSLCWLMFAMASHGVGQTYQGKQLVRAELLADTNAIVPGKPFTVGLLLQMAPGWHTYWKFSGDAGLPTELKWNLPAGWKIGEIQWPIPLKTIDPGDIEDRKSVV